MSTSRKKRNASRCWAWECWSGKLAALLELQEYYITGQCGTVTDVMPKLLGRPSITLDQFLNEFKDSFRRQAAGA